MIDENYPMPENEFLRLLSLSELDLDYTNLQENFKKLTRLAAKVAGTEISLINLLDSYTQWTVGHYGVEMMQTPREDSICQYTIMTDGQFEVPDLKMDPNFNDKFYVNDPWSLRYYFGIPLKDNKGFNIGALCVFGKEAKTLSPEKREMLSIIAAEVVERLTAFKAFNELKEELKEANEVIKKAAHDLRSPIAGILGLSQMLNEHGKNNELNEVLEVIELIHQSSKSILELADDILTENELKAHFGSNLFNLTLFRKKLYDLYEPQAKIKSINLIVNTTEDTKDVSFQKDKLIQIGGNLISNALKFTPLGGKVQVDLDLTIENDKRKKLYIRVKDNGGGLDSNIIAQILNGQASSIKGTSGEKGYGYGLELVKRLVIALNGTIEIANCPGSGAVFKVMIPLD